jgi:queuine/archaeosine tRNA-ribosyltransferase
MVSLHNITFMTRMARAARAAILERRFNAWRARTSADLAGEASTRG